MTRRPPANKIEDEFASLRVSRARKHQLRLIRDGRCVSCGRKRGQNPRKCSKCMAADRKRAAERYAAKKSLA